MPYYQERFLEQLPRVLISIHLDVVNCILYLMLNGVVTIYLCCLEGRCSQNAKQPDWQHLHFNVLLSPLIKILWREVQPQMLTGADIQALVGRAEQRFLLPELSHHSFWTCMSG